MRLAASLLRAIRDLSLSPRGTIMTLKRCKTCRFWRLESWHEKGWGLCTQMNSEDGKPNVPETLAVAQDDESYCAATHTAEDFGCVMHKTME